MNVQEGNVDWNGRGTLLALRWGLKERQRERDGRHFDGHVFEANAAGSVGRTTGHQVGRSGRLDTVQWTGTGEISVGIKGWGNEETVYALQVDFFVSSSYLLIFDLRI